jgi:hypothetical protein
MLRLSLSINALRVVGEPPGVFVDVLQGVIARNGQAELIQRLSVTVVMQEMVFFKVSQYTISRHMLEGFSGSNAK